MDGRMDSKGGINGTQQFMNETKLSDHPNAKKLYQMKSGRTKCFN